MKKNGSDWTPKRVRALRARFGDTQEEFAHRIGVTFVSVSRWEHGHSKPSKLACQFLDTIASTAPKKLVATDEWQKTRGGVTVAFAYGSGGLAHRAIKKSKKKRRRKNGVRRQKGAT